MRFSATQLILALILGWSAAGCRTADPAGRFIAQTDRAPAEKRPKDWERTKHLLARAAPEVGKPAPDFSLPTLDGAQTITRSTHQAGRSLVLAFGNFTCPPFRHSSGELEALFQRYRDRAAFLFVYVQEAHPADGWQMDSNEADGVIFDQPKDSLERQSVARKCCEKLKLSLPCVVDGIDNPVDNLFAGWPERIFVIAPDGNIVYAGKQGPWGFKPKEAERALRRLLNRTSAP